MPSLLPGGQGSLEPRESVEYGTEGGAPVGSHLQERSSPLLEPWGSEGLWSAYTSEEATESPEIITQKE